MKPMVHTTISALCLSAMLTACGPTAAELQQQQFLVQQQMQRQAEEARQAQEAAERQRQAELAARQATERAMESAASEEVQGKSAEAAGQLRTAFDHYRQGLQSLPAERPAERQRLTEAIIRTARRLDPPPAIPQEARDLAIRAEERLRLAESETALEKVLADYRQALQLAPWWGDGYFNLALVLEKALLFAEAREAFRLFLLAAPGSPDEATVRRRLIALEVKEEEMRPTTRLLGDWGEAGYDGRLYGNFRMTLKGTTLTMTDQEKGKKLFSGTVAGATLTGTYFQEWPAKTQDHYRPYCSADFLEKDLRHDLPISATVSDDGSQIAFRLLVPRINLMAKPCQYEGYYQFDKTFKKVLQEP